MKQEWIMGTKKEHTILNDSGGTWESTFLHLWFSHLAWRKRPWHISIQRGLKCNKRQWPPELVNFDAGGVKHTAHRNGILLRRSLGGGAGHQGPGRAAANRSQVRLPQLVRWYEIMIFGCAGTTKEGKMGLWSMTGKTPSWRSTTLRTGTWSSCCQTDWLLHILYSSIHTEWPGGKLFGHLRDTQNIHMALFF